VREEFTENLTEILRRKDVSISDRSDDFPLFFKKLYKELERLLRHMQLKLNESEEIQKRLELELKQSGQSKEKLQQIHSQCEAQLSVKNEEVSRLEMEGEMAQQTVLELHEKARDTYVTV